jgi:hypothetical protein
VLEKSIFLKTAKKGDRDSEGKMTNLEACTDEELEQALARVLTYASGEVLNDAEVQKFYQLYEEIQRRALAVTPRS